MITLSSDFNTVYPAAMRGVLASHTDARLIDIEHHLPRQDVRSSAFWLREVIPYFPPAVHLVVVDPGVGTDRAVLVVEAGEHRFVAPDNGVVIPAARAISEELTMWHLESYDATSSTFHGRDVFAPLAAIVHDTPNWTCADIDGLTQTDSFVDLSIPTAHKSDGTVHGEVIAIDTFGNVITNIPASDVRGQVEEIVRVEGQRLPFVPAYAFVPPGEPLATIGSHGHLELAVNQRRGDEWFGLEVRDRITVQLL